MDDRDALVAAGAELSALGLSPGTSGNLSVRVGETVLMTPTGGSLAWVDPDGLARIELATGAVSGGTPSKEYPLHRAFYQKDPATGAVVHLHSPYAMAASCLPPWSAHSAIAPISPYFVMRVGQTPLIPYLPPGDPGLGDAVLALPFAFDAALLQNHGMVVAAPTLQQATEVAIELEEACRLTVLLAGSEPRLLTAEEATALARRSGTDWEAG